MSTIERTSAPPLQAGQRLRQPEFHDRYHAMPPGTRAELIGGIVYMPSPLRDRQGIVCANAIVWVGVYKCRTPGTTAADNATAILSEDAEVQPDCWLRILPGKGGQSRNVGHYVAGAPELIVEVAGSSRSIDLGPKLLEYERAGALEYVVFAIDPDEVYWHVRQGDRLIRVDPDADGIYRSKAFPGLWLDPHALLDDDGSALLATLDRGLATVEHADFVTDLASRSFPSTLPVLWRTSMADLDQKVPENVDGRFFVDVTCIDCDLCRETAPSNFQRLDDAGYSFVAAQPNTPEEEAACRAAMDECPVEAIGLQS